MNQPVWRMVAVVLALLVGASVFLKHHRSWQRLGRPAVRVEAVPMLCKPQDQGNTNLFQTDTNSVVLPEKVLGYTSQWLPLSWEVYDLLPKDTVYGQRLYRGAGGFEVVTHVVLMGADRTSIHQPEFCLPMQGFAILHKRADTIRITRPHAYDLPVMKMLGERGFRTRDGNTTTARAIYVYWFVADNQLTADHTQRMWWMARDLVRTGVLQRWAYISYLAMCLPGQEDATYARLKEFIAATVPEFQQVAGPPATVAARRD